MDAARAEPLPYVCEDAFERASWHDAAAPGRTILSPFGAAPFERSLFWYEEHAKRGAAGFISQ
jgi:hypothetical protein